MKTKLSLLLFCSLLVLFVWFFSTLPDGKLHLVFCSVGQGDAAYIRSPKGTDILIDGGPDERVLKCLGEKMPFYDRTIELIFLSHPHADHMTGLIEVVKRYGVNQIIDTGADNNTGEYTLWEKLIAEKKIKRIVAQKGQRIMVDNNVVFDVIWPDRNYARETDVNLLSTVVLLSYKSLTVLFTGDINKEIFKKLLIANRHKLTAALTVLKVPHHGAKDGLDEEILNILKPKSAVISVGKNSYGHPSSETLKLLNLSNIKILRTDSQIQPTFVY